MSAPMAVVADTRFRTVLARFAPLARHLYQTQCRCIRQSATVGRPATQQSPNLADTFRRALEKEQRKLFRTTEDDPTKHADRHVGLYYKIPQEEFARFLSKGLNMHYYKMCKCFTENCLMVRRPATEVFKYMQAANYDMPVVRYLLYGETGSGKTCSMAHVIHMCGVQKWLVLHEPWTRSFTEYSKELLPSTHSAGLMDQPLDAAQWLSGFKTMNAPLLKEELLMASQQYVWSKREITEPGTPLIQTIDFALGRVKYATDVMGMVLKEVKLHASAKKLRALVAIDGVNALWMPTRYKKVHNPLLKYDTSELAITHFWRNIIKNDWSGGAVICTVDTAVNYKEERINYMPKYLLGKEGYELFDPMIPIHVPAYEEKELYSTLEYLQDRKFIPTLTDADRDEVMLLSQNNPYEVYRITRTW